MGTSRKASKITQARRERMAKVLELRKAGVTFRKIGEQLDVTHQQAYHDYRDALAEITREPAEEVRDLELARLDDLYLIAYSRARKGNDMRAVDSALKIMDRRAKYLGLDDAPHQDGVNAVRTLLEQLIHDDDPKDQT